MFGFVFDANTSTLTFQGRDGREPQYRFDNSRFTAADFEEPSQRLQTEPGLQWTQHPFATRLIDGGPDRVTLFPDRIKFRRSGEWDEQRLADDQWVSLLHEWFQLTP